MRKISRTISGVTPVAVMTEPMGCPGECIYCPTYPATPRSYTTGSPAVLRARRCDFDARRQVWERLRILEEMGHATDKVELIVMGGTFLATPVDYQYQFIKDCFDALNEAEASSLEEAELRNETAAHRCVGLCIETRPDCCGEEEIARLLQFGATRVELGVQALDDAIYDLVRRGHRVAHVIKATRALKEHGFKVHYHWMPGLPGSHPKHDLDMAQRLFRDQAFRPDGLKLYPTVIVEGTELERWYREGRYQPYPLNELVDLLMAIKSLIPLYVRVSRVMRDIPGEFISGGCRDSYLRDTLKRRMAERGLRCRCIRCREFGHRLRDGWGIGWPELRRLDYEASGGKEVFLSLEDENETLFGLLRMRHCPGGALPASTVIRELHVFGAEVPLGGRSEEAAQHKGMGKMLLCEAERIARDEFHAPRMVVLSGVGARDYYRAEGYHCQGHYMVKELERHPASAAAAQNGSRVLA